MTTSATPVAAVRAAFSGLIDYAGLFPPAQLGMGDAVIEYLAARRGPHAWMLARFIVVESRLGELNGRLEERIPVSAIVDAGTDARSWFASAQHALGRIAAPSHASVEMLEVPLPPLLSQRETYDASIGQYAAAVAKAGLTALPSFIELPRDDRWEEMLTGAVAAMRRYRLGAKLRCGGMHAGDVPPAHQVAAFLEAVSAEGLPFKATAGLHHPIRGYSEERGFVMHGFLNLLAAAARAQAGASQDELIAILEDEDAGNFRFDSNGLHWKDRHLSIGQLAQTRTGGFISYGSCSFEEPVADLTSLGLLP